MGVAELNKTLKRSVDVLIVFRNSKSLLGFVDGESHFHCAEEVRLDEQSESVWWCCSHRCGWSKFDGPKQMDC